MSEKVTLEEFESTGDPMLDDNFEIIFSKLPVNGQDGAKSLRICGESGKSPVGIKEEELS